MSAQRKIIRRAAAAHLAGKTAAGDNVFPSRSQPLWQRYELPAICIYCSRETIELHTEAPREYKRELELRIECAMELSEDADDNLDDLGDHVERLIGRSNRLTFGNEQTVSDILLSSEQLEFRQEGDAVIGSLVMVYTATYYTTEPDDLDAEPIDDLDTVSTNYSLDNAQAAADQAADLVEGLSDEI